MNNTYEAVPWADVLYAGDLRWWKAHGDAVNESGFAGKRYSRAYSAAKRYKALVHKSRVGTSGYNSGQMAIEFAINRHASPIILLGFDGSIKNGVHHHGPHVKTPNPNKSRCQRWMPQFEKLVREYPKARVINCSRYTEIKCFELGKLEKVLAGLDQSKIHPDKAS